MKNTGYIYIIHMTPAYKHAKHYLGFAYDVKERFDKHRTGRGARLTQVAVGAGCKLQIAVIGRGTRHDERRLKNEGHSARHCPFCKRLTKKK